MACRRGAIPGLCPAEKTQQVISGMLGAISYHPADLINELVDNSIGAIQRTDTPRMGAIHVYFQKRKSPGYNSTMLCIQDNGCGMGDCIHECLQVRGRTNGCSHLSEHAQGLKQCLVGRKWQVLTRTGDKAWIITHNKPDRNLWLPDTKTLAPAKLENLGDGLMRIHSGGGTVVRIELTAGETRALLRRAGKKRTRAKNKSVLDNLRIHLERTYRGVMEKTGIRIFVGSMNSPLQPPSAPTRTLDDCAQGIVVSGRGGGTYTIDVARHVLCATARKPKRRVEFTLDGRLLTSRHLTDIYTDPPKSSGDQVIVVDLRPGGRKGLWPSTNTTKTDFNASDDTLENLFEAVRASKIQPQASQNPLEMDEATRTRNHIRRTRDFWKQSDASPPTIEHHMSMRDIVRGFIAPDNPAWSPFQLDYYQPAHTDDSTGRTHAHVIEEHKLGAVTHAAIGQVMNYAIAYDEYLRCRGEDPTTPVRYVLRAKSCTEHFMWQLKQRMERFTWHMRRTQMYFQPWDDC